MKNFLKNYKTYGKVSTRISLVAIIAISISLELYSSSMALRPFDPRYISFIALISFGLYKALNYYGRKI